MFGKPKREFCHFTSKVGDFDAVKVLQLDTAECEEVQFFEDCDFKFAQFAVGNNQKVPGTASGVKDSDIGASGLVDVEPGSKAIKTYATESSFAPGTNFQHNISGSKIRGNSGMIFTINFDPEVADKKSLTIAVMSDWSNWYGNFSVYNEGSASGGLKALKVGEHTYQFFIDSLPSATTVTGSPSDVAFIYLRGANCNVAGTITIQAIF